MNNKIHHEFAYQSRELGAQIEDTLGDPPDHKNYARVVQTLISEYAKGLQIDDVNMLSFALTDYLRFDDPAGLLAQCKEYESRNATKVVTMVSCADANATKALANVAARNPDLARKAILTAFLFKNAKRWMDTDNSLDALEKEEAGNEMEDEDHVEPGQDFVDLFDTRKDSDD